MSVIAQGTTEAPQSDLNRVLANFTEDGLGVRQTADTSSDESQTFEIQADEAETLSRFYEACIEQGIVFDIERLYHQ